MPTLIELSPETRGDVPAEVTHLVEVPIVEGTPEPEFFLNRGGAWKSNCWHGKAFLSNSVHRFARRATPAEIAAQAPSVGRDELVEVCKKVEAWLYRLAAQADKQAEDTRFPSLVEASKADAKNYRAVATELRHAIAAALAAAGKGE